MTTEISDILDVESILFNTTAASKSTAPTTQPWPKLHPALIVLFALILCVAVLLSIIGNFLTCYVIMKSRRLQSTTNYFIVSLSLLALVLSLGAMPFLIIKLLLESWVFEDTVCRLVGIVLQTCLGADVFILVCISLDRYYTIIFPLSFKITRHRAMRMILTAWLVAFIFATPMAYFFTTSEHAWPSKNPNEHNIEYRCEINSSDSQLTAVAAYMVPLTCVEVIVPCVITAMCYHRVLSYIWTTKNNDGSLIHIRRTTNHVPRAKIKIVKILLVVSVVDLLTISSFYTARIAHLVDVYPIYLDNFLLFASLVFLSALAKPTIYLLLNGNFRRGCREVLCWSKLRCYRQELYTVTSASAFAKKNYVAIAKDVPGTGGSTPEPQIQINGSCTTIRTPRPPTTMEYSEDSRRPSSVFDRARAMNRDNWPIKSGVGMTVL